MTLFCVGLHQPVITNRSRLALEYSIFVLLIVEAAMVLICAQDLALIFLAMELLSLALVIFCSLGHGKKTAVIVEALVRYFINNSFTSVSFLFGLSLLYALTGSLNLVTLGEALKTCANYSNASFLLLSLAACLLFYLIFFKLTLVPFHQ